MEDIGGAQFVDAEWRPSGYLTVEALALLWDRRRKLAEAYRQQYPHDLKGIDRHQRRATAVLQAYRLLSTLEQQLGIRIALPVAAEPGQPGGPGYQMS
ncbi:MAG TPA: hypothetical protein VKY56_06495 [Chloroflexota bacterium]|nr:hypothetical protein [Chloroflexota bacterium]